MMGRRPPQQLAGGRAAVAKFSRQASSRMLKAVVRLALC
jgi:hypothetical protein